jgi:hypothetical protein
MTEYGKIHTDGSRSGGQPVFITEKAHTMVLEVLAEWGLKPDTTTPQQLTVATTEALCRAIEQHEATKLENEELRHDLERQMTIANEHVNEAEALRRTLNKVTVSVMDVANRTTLHEFTLDPTKAAYVVPEGSKFGFVFKPEGSDFQFVFAKRDPLVEVIKAMQAEPTTYVTTEVYANRINAALDALGFEIREKGQ